MDHVIIIYISYLVCTGFLGAILFRKYHMRGKLAKLWLLMWKNWKLQLRHPLQTIIEIIVPVLFCIVLVLFRSVSDREPHKAMFYQPFDPLSVELHE